MTKNKKPTKSARPQPVVRPPSSQGSAQSPASTSEGMVAEPISVAGKEPEQAYSERQRLLDERLAEVLRKEGAIADKATSLAVREAAVEVEIAQKRHSLLQEIDSRSLQITTILASVTDREAAIAGEQAALIQRAEELRLREIEVKRGESEMEVGFGELRRAFATGIEQERANANTEIEALRKRRLSELDQFFEDYRQARVKEAETEARTLVVRHQQAIGSERASFAVECQRLMDELNASKAAYEEKHTIQADKDLELRLLQKELTVRQSRLDSALETREDDVTSGIEARRKSFEVKESQLAGECARLRDCLQRSDTQLGLYAELKGRLGDDPEAVLRNLTASEEELKALRKELMERPSAEILDRFKALNTINGEQLQKIGGLEGKISQMQARFADQSALEFEIASLKDANRHLSQRNESLDNTCGKLQDDLRRLNAAYEREADREARIREIESPYFADYPLRAPVQGPLDEIPWLDGIDKSCREYGLVFSRRILHAFHTSIKTAEWSLLTVLAGVSGTGKSELPRLYSHFGGLKFLNVSVQPNWDSQESMLGFFNSIDNKFDSQPLLRLLAQTQKENQPNQYPGLNDVMTLILLDEMNLAHVEMYFAEFLSKLEQRRGLGRGDVPALDVKLGAGIDPYKLPLGRNVLWTGTMNQDETTKTLSDKVLDRGFVIHFPSPTSFERRAKLKPLGDKDNQAAPLLLLSTWKKWCSYESNFNEEEIRPYKGFIEEINTNLGEVGRALGHRVWQSIEYYMANYPDVRAAKEARNTAALSGAMKAAFEDQLVMKVMPKMRGIDTRGRSKTACLDGIRQQLEDGNYAIVGDFDRACEVGYGQFMWNSAEYLRDPSDAKAAEATVPEHPSTGEPEAVPGEQTTAS
jgi:hypothetical protein